MADKLQDDELRKLYADPAAASRQARDKIAAARVWLMKHKPFFGVLARALRVEPSLEVPCFRLTPDDRLRANPIAVLQMRFPALCARLAHGSLHAALAAFGRQRQREPRRWNVAHDLAIGCLLDAADLSVGAVATSSLLSLELPPGASAEAYYQALPEGIAPDPLWCDLCDAPADGPAASAGVPEASSAETGPLSADDRGRELSWKLRLGAALEEEIASGGKTFGDRPGWIDEMVRATIEPPASWSVALQQAVSSLQQTQRSYLRPSRRMSALAGADGVWPDTVSMPGRRIEHAGKLVAVVDTSASIASEMLARFLGTLASVATAEGIDEVRLIQADAVITRDETVDAAGLLFYEVGLLGRGGTDFRQPLQQLADESQRSGERFTVVYLTDLDGRFPDADPLRHLDVLWVVPRYSGRTPPFGRVAEMGGEDL